MNQKGSVNIVLIILVIILAGALGYITLIKKPTPSNTTDQRIKLVGHIEEFEKAVNKAELTEASTYFADKVFMILDESECCGDITANRAKQELDRIKGLVFTFDPNDAVVKEYITTSTSYVTSAEGYIIGVESDPSQKYKAIIGYKVSNNKIIGLFINPGRDR